MYCTHHPNPTPTGKSSILVSLFRLVELEQGSICIDGVDIRRVPLHRLRSSIAIIPQDPVLITGTLRFQLDPCSLHTDTELFAALELVGLAGYVSACLPLGLSEVVLEGGENLSHGQRQLLCISRALLRQTKILVIDEGTSSVDPHSDAIVQTALRNTVARTNCTVVAIAHRTATIADYDHILCLEGGAVAAYGSPKSLLADPNSPYSLLVQSSL